MRRFTTKDLTLAAVLAAVYAALTVLLPVPQFGPVQCRLAEALTVLPFFFPAATPGLVVGCFIANLFSLPAGYFVRHPGHPAGLPADPADAQPLAGPPAAGAVQRPHRGGGDRLV